MFRLPNRKHPNNPHQQTPTPPLIVVDPPVLPITITTNPTYLYAWAFWLGTTLGSFATIETHAVHAPSGATLSSHLRRGIGVYPHQPWDLIGRTTFATLMAWFTIHIIANPTTTPQTHNPQPPTKGKGTT